LGQQALLLASRIASSSFDTGSALASMSRELTAVMDRALDGTHLEAELLDMLKRAGT
jgi:hypothetical protein